MARTVKPPESKSRYATDYLLKNPYANAKAVCDAWKDEGKQGTISATLVNKLRSSLGLAGNLRPKRKRRNGVVGDVPADYAGKKRGQKSKVASDSARMFSPMTNGSKMGEAAATIGSAGAMTISLSAFEELEADIDRLLFKVMRLGGMSALEDGLRRARRELYVQISGKRR
jgi:hypothetical protein